MRPPNETEATSAAPPQYSDSSLLRASDIFSSPTRRGVLPIGKSTFYRWVEDGVLPAGKRVSGTPLWPYSVIKQIGETEPPK